MPLQDDLLASLSLSQVEGHALGIFQMPPIAFMLAGIASAARAIP